MTQERTYYEDQTDPNAKIEIEDTVQELSESETLSVNATQKTLSLLRHHKNKPNQMQKDAIGDVCRTMSSIYVDELNGRHVFDLPTAMGKTTAVRGFIHAVENSSYKGRIVVCCEKVKAICDLKRDLIEEDGIPEEKICLIHSYKYDPNFDADSPSQSHTAPYPSDEGIDGVKHQYVLITHSKLHGGFQNLSHSLLIYDEGLVLGKSFPLDVGGLLGRLAALKAIIKTDRGIKNEQTYRILGWINDVESRLQSAVEKGASVEIVLPRLIFNSFKQDIEPYIRTIVKDSFDSGNVNLDHLIEFLKKAGTGESVRVVKSNGFFTVIFNPTIPEDLQQLVILDASFGIRTINEGVDSLQFPKSYANIKDCSDITIHFSQVKTGRQSTFSKLLVHQHTEVIGEAAMLTKELVENGKKVLLFIHKEAPFNEAYIKGEKLKEE